MKSVFEIICLFIGVYFLGVIVLATDLPCQKPNQSTKSCYQLPDNAVASCVGLYYHECAATNPNLHVFETKDFPDGTVKSATGATHTKQRDCWRKKGCFWDTKANPESCKYFDDWGSWHVKDKIETNPDVVCPDE